MTLLEKAATIIAETEKYELSKEIKGMTFFEVYNKMHGHNLHHDFMYCKEELFGEQTFFDLNYKDICLTVFRVGNDDWELGENVEVYDDFTLVAVVTA